MAENCDHKFVDTNYCVKCGRLAAELSGDQRSSRTLAPRSGAPRELDTPTRAELSDERWRYLPQRALLVPPNAGPGADDLSAELDRWEQQRLARTDEIDKWLRELARRVRNGEVSPEQALLCACFAGERRRDAETDSIGGALLSKRERASTAGIVRER